MVDIYRSKNLTEISDGAVVINVKKDETSADIILKDSSRSFTTKVHIFRTSSNETAENVPFQRNEVAGYLHKILENSDIKRKFATRSTI